MAEKMCSDPWQSGCTNAARVGPTGRVYSWCVDCNQNRDHASDTRHLRESHSECVHCNRLYSNRTPRCPRCLLAEDGSLMVGMTWAIMAGRILPDACVYCGEKADAIDHVRPRSKGGMDNEENLVPSCKPCNNGRGGKHRRLLTEWDPDRVAHGRAASQKIEAEWQRLQGEYSWVTS